MLSLIISLGLITIVSFFITHDLYISSNSKDLGFAVEYNFTSGFSSESKLLRVQKMSLIYSDGETAVVEASGLSKMNLIELFLLTEALEKIKIKAGT